MSMKKYKIVKKSDSLGPLPYPINTIVDGCPWLNWIGIKPPRSTDLYYYDNDCFVEIEEEHCEK